MKPVNNVYETGSVKVEFVDVSLENRIHKPLHAYHKELVVLNGTVYGGLYFYQKTKNGFWGGCVLEPLGDHPYASWEFETKFFKTLEACKEYHHNKYVKKTAVDCWQAREYRDGVWQLKNQCKSRHNLYDEDFHKKSIIGRFCLINLSYMPGKIRNYNRYDAILIGKTPLQQLKKLMGINEKDEFDLSFRVEMPFCGLKKEKHFHSTEYRGTFLYTPLYARSMEKLHKSIFNRDEFDLYQPKSSRIIECWKRAESRVNENWIEWQDKLHLAKLEAAKLNA